jgi:hypothetical protein
VRPVAVVVAELHDYQGEELIQLAAQAAHEVNRAYCLSLGDHSQRSWLEAEQWQRDSAIEGARACYADPARSPGASHVGWLETKQREGWVWGPVKDAAAKVHPCMVPFAELPEHQKAKDTLFVTTVRGVFSAYEVKDQ